MNQRFDARTAAKVGHEWDIININKNKKRYLHGTRLKEKCTQYLRLYIQRVSLAPNVTGRPTPKTSKTRGRKPEHHGQKIYRRILTLLFAFRRSEMKFCNPLACDDILTKFGKLSTGCANAPDNPPEEAPATDHTNEGKSFWKTEKRQTHAWPAWKARLSGIQQDTS